MKKNSLFKYILAAIVFVLPQYSKLRAQDLWDNLAELDKEYQEGYLKSLAKRAELELLNRAQKEGIGAFFYSSDILLKYDENRVRTEMELKPWLYSPYRASAVGIGTVVGLVTAYSIYKFFKWVGTPTPTLKK